MDVGSKTLTVLQMAVPYFSANCISAKCTGEDVPSRRKLASVCYAQLLLLIQLLCFFQNVRWECQLFLISYLFPLSTPGEPANSFPVSCIG